MNLDSTRTSEVWMMVVQVAAAAIAVVLFVMAVFAAEQGSAAPREKRSAVLSYPYAAAYPYYSAPYAYSPYYSSAYVASPYSSASAAYYDAAPVVAAYTYYK
ncbi:hypothetical protein J6590_001998 [Homalodisca vitripennis]|nr:hypothetical protein J6590_001998 [Homalodisca vitripennis]